MKKPVFRHLAEALTIVLMLALAACGSPEDVAQTQPATEATADAPAAVAQEAAEESAPADGQEAVDEMAGVTETEGLAEDTEESEEIQLNEEQQATAETATQDWRYKEGEHYRRLTTSQGTSSAPDKIEVAEVFWYGCPHCYNFDPVLNEWKKSLPADVSFVRIPVIWNPTNQVHARLMYTAEALGVLDQVHEEVFKSIHQRGDMLTNEADMVEIFEDAGIDEAAFQEAYKSFGVSSAVKRAENLTRRYGIRSVPVLVINGKYVTDAPDIKTFDDMIGVTNELVERERSGG